VTDLLPETRDRRGLLFLAAATLIPFFLLAVWARFWSPAPWEPDILLALAAQPGPIGATVDILNTLGNLPIWAVVIGVSAIVTGMLRGLAAALLVALSFASDLAAFGVKLVVERDRPETAAVDQFFGLDSFSYPSGHTVRAAALAAVLVWLFAPPRWRLPLAALGGVAAGAAMGFARVSLGVHWPTDTIGGTLLGLGWFALTAALIWVEPFRKANRPLS
jgi:membrane-associated phospholipid phosphatase